MQTLKTFSTFTFAKHWTCMTVDGIVYRISYLVRHFIAFMHKTLVLWHKYHYMRRVKNEEYMYIHICWVENQTESHTNNMQRTNDMLAKYTGKVFSFYIGFFLFKIISREMVLIKCFYTETSSNNLKFVFLRQTNWKS